MRGPKDAFFSRADDLLPTDVIYEAEGTKETYTMTVSYLSYNNTGMINVQAEECSAELVFGENDEVYFYDMQSVMGFGSYIKGTKDGDQIRFDFPQAVVDYGDGMCIYLNKMVNVNPTDLTAYDIVEEDNYVTYTIYDDGTIAIDLDNSIDEAFPQYIIGITYGYNNEPLNKQTWM